MLFEAVVGRHEIRVEIDPDNDVIESADQFMDGGTNDNNCFEATILVMEDERPPDLLFGLVLFVIAILTGTTVAYILYMRNRMGRNDLQVGSREE